MCPFHVYTTRKNKKVNSVPQILMKFGDVQPITEVSYHTGF